MVGPSSRATEQAGGSPGSRIDVSPFARRAFIDHTPCEPVSILKLLERRHGLAPLSSRDAAVSCDLTSARDLK